MFVRVGDLLEGSLELHPPVFVEQD